MILDQFLRLVLHLKFYLIVELRYRRSTSLTSRNNRETTEQFEFENYNVIGTLLIIDSIDHQ